MSGERASFLWWHRSFILDYVSCVLLLLLGGAVELFVPIFERVSPFTSFWHSGTNTSFAISKPFSPVETVPTSVLAVISLVVPLLIFSIRALVLKGRHGSSELLHASSLALVASLSLTTFATTCLKVSGGRLRPDFVDRVELDKNLHSGRESWPSGHAALSAAGMMSVSLWIAGSLGIFAKGGNLIHLLVVLSPHAISAFVAVSRTRDYRHNFDDISTGYALGATLTYVVWSLYFHPLSSTRCGYPRDRLHRDAGLSISEDAQLLGSPHARIQLGSGEIEDRIHSMKPQLQSRDEVL